MLIEAPILVVRGKREYADLLVSSDTTDCPETAGLSYGFSGAGRNNELVRQSAAEAGAEVSDKLR